MAAVTQGLIPGLLAGTEENTFGFGGLPFLRLEFGSDVGAVTERLSGGFTAGAPEVSLAFFHLNRDGGIPGSLRIAHRFILLKLQ